MGGAQMQEPSEVPAVEEPQHTAVSPWRLAGWLCVGVIIVSVGACIVMAALRSNGLTKITVTALDAASEPRDHNLPLIKQKEALPDYELTLILTRGDKVRLGAKPDTSAVDGLTWSLSDSVSIADVASVRLREQDKVISDAVAEVQILGASTTANGYRFDFTSKRSASVGVNSFFGTPIGKAIACGLCVVVLLVILSVFQA